MEKQRKRISTYDIVLTALLAAVVFVTTMLSIRIPTPTGTTMIKLANAFVLLAGLLLGPMRGGLAAGLGSMIFDLITPEYAPEAWLTFVRFFLMAYLCGLIAHRAGARAQKTSRNAVAVVAATVFSTLFYQAKNILVLMLAGSAFAPAVLANVPKLIASVPNLVIAIAVSLLLLPMMQKAMVRAGVKAPE